MRESTTGTVTITDSLRQISEDESVTLNGISNGEFNRTTKHRAVKGETVKFSVLAAWIDSIGQRPQRIVISKALVT